MAQVFKAFDNMSTSDIRDNVAVFERLASANDDVTFDMSQVRFIDGSGVGAIVYVKRRLNAAGRDAKVINLSGQPYEVIDDLGLVRFFNADGSRRSKR